MAHIRRIRERWTHRAGVTILAFAGAELITTEHAGACCRQIERVAQRARIITLDEAVRGLSREDHSVDNTVVITVDDGTEAFASSVVPFLVRLHVPATLYLATDVVELQRRLGTGAATMTWSAVGEALETSLVTIGSRGHTGASLDRAGAAAASAEIGRSIELIVQRTGRTPMHFAYPGALSGSSEAREVVSQHFRSASVAGGGINAVGRTDLHHLVRPVLTPRTRPIDVDALIRPGRSPRSRGRGPSAAWPGALDAPGR
jgi:peptidoglycan/xylan/chitin deacetylase (PgdA/CDA1 family)